MTKPKYVTGYGPQFIVGSGDGATFYWIFKLICDDGSARNVVVFFNPRLVEWSIETADTEKRLTDEFPWPFEKPPRQSLTDYLKTMMDPAHVARATAAAIRAKRGTQ